MKNTSSSVSSVTRQALRNAQPALIQSVDEAALLDLLSRGTVLSIPASTEFVRQGRTQISGIYMILEGMVGQDEAVAGGSRHLTCAMGPGEFLGEINSMGEVNEGLSSVTLRTHGACQLIFISKSEVNAWLDAHPGEQAQLMKYLGRESLHRREFAAGVVGNA